MRGFLFLIMLSLVFIISCESGEVTTSKKEGLNVKTKVDTGEKPDSFDKKNVQKLKVANTFYQKGFNAYKLKEWSSAVEYFDRTLELNSENTKAQKYKKLAIREKANKALLKDAERLLAKNDYLLAMLKLKRIKDTSVYFTEARDGIKESKNQYKHYRFSLAQKAFETKDYKRCSSYLKSILDTYPDYDDAIKLREKLDKELEGKK